MSILTITNKQPSVLDLSPLRDTSDVVLVLRPRGSKGDSREISKEVADDDVIARVQRAGWVDVKAVVAAAPVVAPAPAPAPAPVVVAPAPVVEAPAPVVVEAVAEVPVSDALAVEAAPAVEAAVVEPAQVPAANTLKRSPNKNK